MGFILALFYLTVNYLGTNTVFGQFAAFHVEMIMAGLIVLVTIPVLPRSSAWRRWQSVAMVGLSAAAFLSVLTGQRWPGGAVSAFMDFIPHAFAFFLVVLYFDSRKKLKILVLMLIFVCLFVITRGFIESFHPPSVDPQLLIGQDEKDIKNIVSSPYRLAMRSDTGQMLYRLRGQNLLNDPNDFAQFILTVIPLVFLFWRQEKKLRNTVFVLMPVAILLYGVYDTHSRGALVGLMAMVAMALRRRIGTFFSLAAAGGIFALAMVLQFTGGRAISASSGADRADLWGLGLELLKANPLFGVGFKQMAQEVGHTAHNSIVVCAAELGLFGLFFWTLFLVPTVQETARLATAGTIEETDASAPSGKFQPQFGREQETWPQVEIHRWGQLLVLSLTGFLVAGFFLSRALVLTFFLLGGVVDVVYTKALAEGMVPSRMSFSRVFKYTATLTIGLVLFMYIVTRILNVLRH